MKFLTQQSQFYALGIKHFKADEFRCKCCGNLLISMELVILLDNLREALGEPLIIASGYRCSKHNAEVGGSPNSAHLTGKAVDLKINDSRMRFKIMDYLLSVGIDRIGIAKDFIHFDIDEDRPKEVIWLY